MQEEYVTQREFDLQVKRLDEKTEIILQRLEDKLDAQQSLIQLELRAYRADAERYQAQTEKQLSEMRGEMHTELAKMNGRIDKLENSVNWLGKIIGWGLGVIAIIIPAAIFAAQYFLPR